MKRLLIHNFDQYYSGDKTRAYFRDDVRRIQRIMRENGIRVTSKEAVALWVERSDAYCACWLVLPQGDQAVYDEILEYCQFEVMKDGEVKRNPLPPKYEEILDILRAIYIGTVPTMNDAGHDEVAQLAQKGMLLIIKLGLEHKRPR